MNLPGLEAALCLSSILFKDVLLGHPTLLTPRKQNIHLLGVAGSGMSGIAGLLLALGHNVSGSDKATSAEVKRLCQQGLNFYPMHSADHIADVDLVIYSSAIKAGNPAFDESIRLNKKMLKRAEALAALLNTRRGIIVAGMHGKTTTSSMAAFVLKSTNFQPSYYVGAEIPLLGTNAYWDKQGEYFVAEGDESDGTLTNYHPEHSIILNIEEEHLDFYPDLEAINTVFRQLIQQTRGSVFYCLDDKNATRLCEEESVHPTNAESDGSLARRFISYGFDPKADYIDTEQSAHLANVEANNSPVRKFISYGFDPKADYIDTEQSAHSANKEANDSPGRKFISYGFDPKADYSCKEHTMKNYQSRFTVYHHDQLLGDIELNVPGKHNISNALATIALVNELGGSFSDIQQALAHFSGAKRRFEFKYKSPQVSVLDDYGHHPSEIRATLETARNGHSGRIITLFQPHRYSRTKLLKNQFGQAFHSSDIVLIAPIYAASELPLEGITGQTIADALHEQGFQGKVIYCPSLLDLKHTAAGLLQLGDLILSLGAGNIHEVSKALVEDIIHWEQISKILGSDGTIKLYEPFSKHTTLKVGGPAQFWVDVHTEKAFAKLIEYSRSCQLPFFVIGRGSNLLVKDGGMDGLVIHPSGGDFIKLEVDAEKLQITAGVGVSLKRVAAAAAKAHLGGFEWMDGIPGSVGGSLRMNAGAMGYQTFEQVTQIRVISNDGKIEEKTPDQIEIYYRHVPSLKNQYALSATFQGISSTADRIKEGLNASLVKRKTSQPIAASAGCIFKNPSAECPAGLLVDQLSLKNTCIGKARVSEVHGNFIVNDGGATATDVLALISSIQQKALEQRQIRLETEVQIVGKEL